MAAYMALYNSQNKIIVYLVVLDDHDSAVSLILLLLPWSYMQSPFIHHLTKELLKCLMPVVIVSSLCPSQVRHWVSHHALFLPLHSSLTLCVSPTPGSLLWPPSLSPQSIYLAFHREVTVNTIYDTKAKFDLRCFGLSIFSISFWFTWE